MRIAFDTTWAYRYQENCRGGCGNDSVRPGGWNHGHSKKCWQVIRIAYVGTITSQAMMLHFLWHTRRWRRRRRRRCPMPRNSQKRIKLLWLSRAVECTHECFRLISKFSDQWIPKIYHLPQYSLFYLFSDSSMIGVCTVRTCVGSIRSLINAPAILLLNSFWSKIVPRQN
jgi:hypothetical protein